MSKFFKALEQADRERGRRDEERRSSAPPVVSTDEQEPERAVPPAPSAEEVVAPAQAAAAEPGGEIDAHLVSLLTPASFASEQYRALRYTVEEAHQKAGLVVLGVTSPTVRDGKTTTAINLVGALAQGWEARVLLLDADLRAASIATQLGLKDPDMLGLADALLDPSIDLDGLVRPCPPFNFSVLPAGRSADAPYELLKSPRFGQLLEEARRRYDFIVLDLPPVVPIPDCRVISKWVDGYLIVVRAHRSPRKLLEETLNVLEPDKVVGLVFNADDRMFSGYHTEAGYGYGIPYGARADNAKTRWWRQTRDRIRGRARPRKGRR
jgi:capsular exopolysaccharide synthesis family protein